MGARPAGAGRLLPPGCVHAALGTRYVGEPDGLLDLGRRRDPPRLMGGVRTHPSRAVSNRVHKFDSCPGHKRPSPPFASSMPRRPRVHRFCRRPKARGSWRPRRRRLVSQIRASCGASGGFMMEPPPPDSRSRLRLRCATTQADKACECSQTQGPRARRARGGFESRSSTPPLTGKAELAFNLQLAGFELNDRRVHRFPLCLGDSCRARDGRGLPGPAKSAVRPGLTRFVLRGTGRAGRAMTGGESRRELGA